MKLYNMKSSNGNNVPNQFIIDDGEYTYFQSYQTMIAKYKNDDTTKVYLDKKWYCSRTTSKYLYSFLWDNVGDNVNKPIVEQKIKEGIYLLTDLNK